MTYFTFDDISYRGEYSSTYPSGEPSRYYTNDAVLFEGKLFVATAAIVGESPDISSRWIPWGNSRISFRDTEPPDPKVGDKWLIPATGKLYTFIDDTDTKQWVEL
ncbi:MAG TPA: hypothetical protein DF712_19055 [Balneola sp.]|nr:hypothetical protein [Balneola sp.]|tara:strand:+ start:280 stop:594 length:315 start_codon:yes stop_codon:yes gene_type:complete